MSEARERVKFSKLANFTPKQLAAKKAVREYKFTLYGGAMGGGKSRWLRWMLLYLLLYFYSKYKVEGVRVGLFCEDYPALKDRQISKIAYEFPEWLGTMNKADHEFVLHPEYGSGVLAFRNLDDPSKYQSAEFAAIGIDELTKNPRQAFDDLRTRMRWPGIPAKEWKFLAGTNPGSIGHVWVKKMWIDHEFDPGEEEAAQFVYVHAKSSDNPYIDRAYELTLNSLPEAMRKAFKDGDWNIFKGQYFGEWSPSVHVVVPFELPRFWKRFVCGDYGYSAPSAVYWCAASPDDKIYVYRELYVTKRTPEDLMREIVSVTPATERLEYMVFDPAIWSKKDSPVSPAEIMEATYKTATGGQTIRMVRGNNDRLNGARVVREYLKPVPQPSGEIAARLQVFSTCTELIRTLPGLVHDKINVEDVDTKGEDHAYDAIRYGLVSEPPKTQRATTGVVGILERRGSGPRSQTQTVRSDFT